MSQTFEPTRSADERPRPSRDADLGAWGGPSRGDRPVTPWSRGDSQPGGTPAVAFRAAAGRPVPFQPPVTPDDPRGHAASRAWTQDMHGFGAGRSIGMPAAVDAQSVVNGLGVDEPVMALVGADAGYLGAEDRTDREPGDDRRATRRSVAEANAALPDGGDDRGARRGRSFSGPAAGRALGSKIFSDDGGAAGKARGADRGRPGRRYMPEPEVDRDRPAADDLVLGHQTGPMESVPGGMPLGGIPSGPVPQGPIPTGPIPTGPIPTDPMPTGPMPTGPVHLGPRTGPVPTGPMRPGMQQDTGPVGPYGAPPTPPITSGSAPWLPGEQEPIGITAALGDPFTDTGASQMLRPYDNSADLSADGPGPSLVRPYARTGGRTKPGHDLDLEALVVTTVNGREAWSSPLLNPEHVQVIGLCVDTTSVAEIAARLSVPIGVARVIIADMVDLGLVEVGKTSANSGDERDPAFLRRVLSGLQRL